MQPPKLAYQTSQKFWTFLRGLNTLSQVCGTILDWFSLTRQNPQYTVPIYQALLSADVTAPIALGCKSTVPPVFDYKASSQDNSSKPCPAPSSSILDSISELWYITHGTDMAGEEATVSQGIRTRGKLRHASIHAAKQKPHRHRHGQQDVPRPQSNMPPGNASSPPYQPKPAKNNTHAPLVQRCWRWKLWQLCTAQERGKQEHAPKLWPWDNQRQQRRPLPWECHLNRRHDPWAINEFRPTHCWIQYPYAQQQKPRDRRHQEQGQPRD